MELQVGHIIKGKLPFRDGKTPLYKRPYLVIKIDGDKVDLLNVSSTSGKEWKLTMASNLAILNYNPPLVKSSFVKLDSRTTFLLEEIAPIEFWGTEPLCESEINRILNALEQFESKH